MTADLTLARIRGELCESDQDCDRRALPGSLLCAEHVLAAAERAAACIGYLGCGHEVTWTGRRHHGRPVPGTGAWLHERDEDDIPSNQWDRAAAKPETSTFTWCPACGATCTCYR